MCLRNVSSSAGGKVGPPQRLQCKHVQTHHKLQQPVASFMLVPIPTVLGLLIQIGAVVLEAATSEEQ